MTWLRWAVIAVGAVVVWVGSVALAVAVAVDDDDDDGPGDRTADQADYTVDLAECVEPEGQDEGGPPVPTRRAEGTLTNVTDERRSFRLQVAFETEDSVRVDWAPALVDELGPGETARWEAASYLDAAGAEGVTCQVAAVEYVPEGAAGTELGSAGRPPLPPVVFSTSDNVDEAGPDGAGSPGDVGDIDAVSYICYVVNPRVPVTCGTVSN